MAAQHQQNIVLPSVLRGAGPKPKERGDCLLTAWKQTPSHQSLTWWTLIRWHVRQRAFIDFAFGPGSNTRSVYRKRKKKITGDCRKDSSGAKSSRNWTNSISPLQNNGAASLKTKKATKKVKSTGDLRESWNTETQKRLLRKDIGSNSAESVPTNYHPSMNSLYLESVLLGCGYAFSTPCPTSFPWEYLAQPLQEFHPGSIFPAQVCLVGESPRWPRSRKGWHQWSDNVFCRNLTGQRAPWTAHRHRKQCCQQTESVLGLQDDLGCLPNYEIIHSMESISSGVLGATWHVGTGC